MTTFRARGDDQGLADRVQREARGLRERMRSVKREVGEDAELIFAAHALKGETGRLSRGIRAIAAGDAIIVRADAKNPTSGYDYVGVTRFGHRAKWIYPRSDRRPASAVATHSLRRRDQRAALAIHIGGRVIFRSRVRGFRPRSDWAADAIPEVVEEANIRLAEFGRDITARLA